jgi:signal transduction histidine kinase
MSTATLARASEPFFTTKPPGQGTDLGLAMARGFAHQSGGGFAIESTPGRGTTVTLWFPEVGGVGAASAEPALPGSMAPSVPMLARVLERIS